VTAPASGSSQKFPSDRGTVGLLDGALADEARQASAAVTDLFFARPVEAVAAEE
jgi:hypothetical protein